MRVAVKIEVPESDRKQLERWSSSRSVPVRLRERSLVVLKASEGKTNKEIAADTGMEVNKVGRWRRRYAEAGLAGIRKERPRGGNQGGRSDAEREALRGRIVELTTTGLPKDATQWSCRTMAREVGASRDFVNATWRANGLKPHLSRTFKLSTDPDFEAKLRDVVGLYLDPPENAVVFSFDEKSSIQALDRTQPGLPMKKGRCGTMTHDYKRHGTTSLFAALNVASGEVVGRSFRRHRHQEVLRFLKEVEKTVPPEQDVHIVLDNYATHKHEKVEKWVKRKKRVHLHFTPTSASWLNLVERFFAQLAEKRLRRGVFTSVCDLEKSIRRYLDTHNENPRPLVWTKSTAEILEKVERARAKLVTAS